jgi:hypothetical protein
MRLLNQRFCTVVGSVAFLTLPLTAYPDDHDFIEDLHVISTIASTVPGNGDVNPYGIATVPITTGALVKGEILISNFNNSSNLQGTGTTIVEMTPSGNLKVFATIDPGSLPGPCPGGVGLSTALAVLRSGFVIVGSLPTSDGTSATAKAGCLIVLNSSGQPVLTLAGNGINGPWDMTAVDFDFAAVLFVTNVLNGTVAADGAVASEGSVLRILLLTPPGGEPREVARKIIASSFEERTDPAALVIGPTGLGFAPDGRLFVADTLQNRIAVIRDALFRVSDAGAGDTVSQGAALNQPLGLAIAPNGDILTVNGGDGNIVETTAHGRQTAVKGIDVSQQGAGTLFGLAITPNGKGVYFVDDGNNTLNLLH